jgi:hypothetical protein
MKNILTLTILFCVFILSGCSKTSSDASATSGANGSLTRFITAGNYLYIVDNSKLNTFSIANPATPVLKNTTNIGFSIQTIFLYKDQLFIGSSDNMYIYTISNPEKPTLLSGITYFVRGRDPIVANDTVAFSTVRSSWGSGGVLNVFNVKNINLPQNVQILNMQNPYGLGMKDSALYVCEATFGLKVFNIKNAYQPLLSKTLNLNETAYDIIIEGNLLICYIKGGLCFVDITNAFNPVVIATVKN